MTSRFDQFHSVAEVFNQICTRFNLLQEWLKIKPVNPSSLINKPLHLPDSVGMQDLFRLVNKVRSRLNVLCLSSAFAAHPLISKFRSQVESLRFINKAKLIRDFLQISNQFMQSSEKDLRQYLPQSLTPFQNKHDLFQPLPTTASRSPPVLPFEPHNPARTQEKHVQPVNAIQTQNIYRKIKILRGGNKKATLFKEAIAPFSTISDLPESKTIFSSANNSRNNQSTLNLYSTAKKPTKPKKFNLCSKIRKIKKIQESEHIEKKSVKPNSECQLRKQVFPRHQLTSRLAPHQPQNRPSAPLRDQLKMSRGEISFEDQTGEMIHVGKHTSRLKKLLDKLGYH